MSVEWPNADELAAIFRRLRAGDPLAKHDFAEAVIEPSVCHLRRSHRHADDHALWTAATDAVWSVIRNPAVYDPTRGTLRWFLCMAAEGDFLNATKKERRHHSRRERRECVEVEDPRGNTRQEAHDAEGPSFDDAAVAAEINSFSPADRNLFELMRGGVKQTAAFAPLLGVEHLPNDEQSRAVKRAKDRIIKRLQRVGRKA